MRHGAEASSKVDELKQRISKVSEMISGMMSVSLSESKFPVPPFNPVNDNLEYPQIPTIPEQHSLNFPPPTVAAPSTSAMDLSGLLNVSDQSRKRCASELEEQRTVKAPKREPQDDIPLSALLVETPLPVETSPLYAAPGPPLPVTTALAVVSHSRPPSRPPTPPGSFSAHGPFGPVKQQPPAVPNYPFMPAASSPLDFTSNLTTPVTSTSPTFPGLHTSWSDGAIPSRHQHSLSTGSLNGSLQGLSVAPPTPLEAFPAPSLRQLPPPTLAGPPGTANIGPPLGRMSRSGSINGTFTNPFGFGFMDQFAEPAPWPGMGRVSTQTPTPNITSNWFGGSNLEGSVPSVSSSTPEVPGTTRNTPTDEEDEDEDADSEYNDGSPPKSDHHLASVYLHLKCLISRMIKLSCLSALSGWAWLIYNI